MMDIATVGHFSIDFIRLPGRRVMKPALGGPPTYVSLAALRLGAKVSAVSKVGEDFPERYLRWMKNQGVELTWVRKVEDAQTTSFILDYHGVGERQLFLKNRAPPIEAEDIPDSFEAKAVHIAPIANEVSPEAIVRLRRMTSLVSLDPQGLLRRFKENGKTYLEKMENLEILRNIDIFKASQREIEAVTGRSDLVEAIGTVLEHGVNLVVVTRAAEGALLYIGGKLYQVPAAKPKVVIDTTGSGDVFIGAFLAEYIKGKDPLWCASVGSASASFVIERLGPRRFGSEKEVYDRAIQVYGKTSAVAGV